MTTLCVIRARVRELHNSIRNAKDHIKYLECLKEVHKYLPQQAQEIPNSNSKPYQDEQYTNEEEKAIFMEHHYINFGKLLLETMAIDTVGHFTKIDFSQYFINYFLLGCCQNAFLTLTFATQNTGPGFKLNKCVLILEEFLRRHKLSEIFHEESGLNRKTDASLYTLHTLERTQLWDTLVTEIVALPDKMANKLKSEVREIFLPKNYVPLLVSDILRTLASTCRIIRLSKDCSLEFISRLIGKLCISGYANQFWEIMLQEVMCVVRGDYIMSRVCERIVTGVPDRCMESVLVPLVKTLPWYGLMDRFLGNCVIQKQKVHLLLCTKLIFHRYFKSAQVLQNVIGYLATSAQRQHLFIQLLLELIQVWGDQSSITHTCYDQHFYLTQALVICMAFITEAQKQQHKDEILRLLMPGVQTHIGVLESRISKLGMFIAELVTSTVDPEGPKFSCDIDSVSDPEITSLKALLVIPEDPFPSDSITDELSSFLSENMRDISLNNMARTESEVEQEPVVESQQSKSSRSDNDVKDSLMDLDSDDDLEPYDMSNDTKLSKVKQPKYIGDILEGLISNDDQDLLDICLSNAETMIRSNPDGLSKISVELAKVLLHLIPQQSMPNSQRQRFNALVALTVTCPKEVAEFLTAQFYERNYSIQQRVDIIEVLGTGAQELHKPTDVSSLMEKHTAQQNIEELPPSSSEPEMWQEIVQKRIDSKTRHFGQRRTKPKLKAVENRFASVAGYFFYPLMKNFDRQENTFDLLGEDCYVLRRLMFTLGVIMYAATNIPTVRQMASALLEFIWVLRFHFDAGVRQSLLFALSMVYLAVPAHMLLYDLQQEVFESMNWLENVIEKDTDTQCKTVALQALVLLENIKKQECKSGTD